VHTINATAGCSDRPTTVPGLFSGACYVPSEDTAYFGIGSDPATNKPLNFDTTEDKFVMGHELGHMAQNWSTGSTGGAYSTDNGRPSACKCDGVVSSNRIHCLNSRENVGAASIEGWGHFMSAKLLNNPASTTCSFGYYKEIWNGVDATGTVIVKRPPSQTSVSCLTPVKWRNNKCAQAEAGNEWDWLTFLTNVHTQGVSKLSMAELTDVWQRACGSTTGVKCAGQQITWTSTAAPAPGVVVAPVDNAAKAKFGALSAKYGNWVTTADNNGVSNNLSP
jgi:hypothetical protein